MNKLKKQSVKMFAFIGLMILCNEAFSQKVRITTSSSSVKWEKTTHKIKNNLKEITPDITVYTDSVLQKIDGIGGAFNELGWEAITALDSKGKTEVIDALFSKDGAHFSMCRIPVGASDYALSYYSHNDVPEDFEMRDFNIDRDRYILIPYLKAALQARPDLQIWASPWSPPAWMKVNEHYAMRSGNFENAIDGNKMDPGAEILNNATAFKMQERYLEAYALYFSKFVKAYKDEGVPLFAIMPQNEIAFQPNWPSCTWRPLDMAYFIHKYLGPKLELENPETKIWLGTVNSGDPNYVKTVLEYKETSKYIDGVGFQWGGAKAIPTVHKEYPGLKLMQTENKCGEHENDWTSVERSWKDLVHYFKNGAGSYMYWNMVLDETGASDWGWPQNSMIVIDKTSKKISYTDEFYLFKHLSHFIQPGDRYLQSSAGKNHLAFKLQTGKTVVLVYNSKNTKETKVIKIGDKKLSVNLAPKSISTIEIDK